MDINTSLAIKHRFLRAVSSCLTRHRVQGRQSSEINTVFIRLGAIGEAVAMLKITCDSKFKGINIASREQMSNVGTVGCAPNQGVLSAGIQFYF